MKNSKISFPVVAVLGLQPVKPQHSRAPLEERLPDRFTLHKAQLFDAPVAEAVSTKPFGHWDWPLRYATPELALLELASEGKQNSDFDVLDKLFESATSLRPQLLMKQLKACHHVKAKRLFLWFAERHGFAWFKRLEFEVVNLGSGKRVIVKGGKLDKNYLITVPREMSTPS